MRTMKRTNFCENKEYGERLFRGIVPISFKNIKGFVFTDNAYKYTVITSLTATLKWDENFKPCREYEDRLSNETYHFKDMNLIYKAELAEDNNTNPAYSLERLTYDIGLYDKITSSSMFYEPKEENGISFDDFVNSLLKEE